MDSPRARKLASARRISRAVKAVGAVTFVATLMLLWTWYLPQVDGPDDVYRYEVEFPDDPLPLAQLRALGERVAESYGGAKDMGMAAAKAELRPINWARVQQSCTPESPEQKTVLVTGTGGFVGMHVAIHLRHRGDGVLGLDNFNDYYPVSLKRARQAAGEAAGVYTVDADLNDALLLRRLFNTCKFTHVLHLAAQAGVRYATRNPYSYVHANLGGHVTMLEVAKEQSPMPTFVYASSSSVYGLNSKQPFSEDDRVDAPASLYAATKRADELISHVYHNIHGMSVTGLRFFTVYGPWGRPDMAAYSFAVKIMRGEAIRIFQGPKQQELKRDFTFIDDIAAGVLGALDHAPPSGKGGASHCKVYNLGNTSPHTVTELVEALERHLGRKAIREYVPVPPTGDVLATFADVKHAREEIGYSPSTSLDAGVARFVEWFRRYYGAEVMEGRETPADWSYKPM